MTNVEKPTETKQEQGGRVVKRWIAECDFVDETGTCEFNKRKEPTLHERPQSAVSEARDHAQRAGHFGAREVTVRRTFKPRELAKEEVIS